MSANNLENVISRCAGERHARLSSAACVALVALLFTAATAHGQVGSATLSGSVVLAKDGAPLAAVVVTARDEARGTTYRATTDQSGYYRIPLLRPGSYEVSVQAQGFAAYRRVGLKLAVGTETELQIELRPAVEASVNVAGVVPVVDPTSSQIAVNIAPEQVATIPLLNRNYLDLAFLAPGTTPSRDAAFNGTVSAGAQEARNTFVNVDGADNNTFIFGGQLTPISQEAVQEFQVITTNFNAEYGRSNSVIINVLTKSGSNTVHGSVYDYYRDDRLSQADFFGNNQPYRRNQSGFTLGGPFAQERAFYFLAYDDLNLNIPAEVIIPVRPDLSGSVPITTKDKVGLFKTDINLSSSSRLMFSYRYEDKKLTNTLVGGGQAESFGVAEADRFNYGTVTFDATPSANFFNNLRAYGYRSTIDSVPNSNFPNQLYPSYTFGQNPRFPQGGVEERAALADTGSWLLGQGKHFVKIGGEYSHWKSDLFFKLYTGGQFQYRSDNPAATPTLYIAGGGNPTTVNAVNFFTAFAQDEWRVSGTVTLNLGLRWDYEDKANDPDFVSPYKWLQTPKPDKHNYQPRLGFAWDVKGDGRTIVHGGAGIFYGQIFSTATLNQDIFDGVKFKIIAYPCALFPSVCANPLVRPTPPTSGITPAPDIRILDSKLTTPSTNMFNVGVAHVFANDWSVGADAVYILGLNELLEIRENLRVDPSNPNSPRPHPEVGSIRSVHSGGSSEYTALLTTIRKRFSDKGELQIAYTLSKALNEAEFYAVAVSDSRAANPITNDWGPARTDQRHRLVASGSYQLPFGFTVGSVLTVASGQPWSIRLGYDANLDDSTDMDRPAGVKRNSELSNTYVRWDMRLAKRFHVDGTGFELIGEVFNLTNNKNYDPGTYSNVVSAADFGQPRPSTNDLYQSRRFQFGLKFSF